MLDTELLGRADIAFSKYEKVVWSGSPKKHLSIALFETLRRDESFSAIMVIESIVVLCLANQLFKLNLNIISLVFYGPLLLSIILFEASNNYRKSKTKYILTNKRIIIKTLKRFKIEVHEISLDEIGSTSCVGFKDGHGTIFLQLINPSEFKTYDFAAGYKRHHPKLELISNYKEVDHLIKNEVSKLLKSK